MENKEELQTEEIEINPETDNLAEETVPESEVVETEEVENEAEAPSEESETEKMQAEIADLKDKYLRLYSDFDNFRKRTAKERIEQRQNASEDMIKEFLVITDDIERASTNAAEGEISEGIQLIFSKFNKILTSKGLKPMESKGTEFNVDLHECITQFPAGDEMSGKVVDEVEKGYFLNDKVIRFAKVVVGS
jgi:molecular chaperone GrpE